MGALYVTEFMSLDGVIEAPGGGEEYRHAAWSFAIERGDEGNRFKLEETMGTDALLLGRVTYDGFAAAWPRRTGEFADKFNTMPKYVVSSALTKPAWNNTRVLKGDVAREVGKVKQTVRGTIGVHGSPRLAQAPIEHGLVDELHLMVFPILLGEGKRLFGDLSDKQRWKLIESKTVGDGVLILRYVPEKKS